MSTGGKQPPLLVLGAVKAPQKSPVMQKKDIASKAAMDGASQSSLLTGGAYSLVGKAQSTDVGVDQAVKSRCRFQKL